MLFIGKLTALKVAREQRPGMYSDGGGLYLCIARGGTKSWIFRFWVPERDVMTGELVIDPTTKKRSGRVREMGLGSCITVSLAEARERALECRKLREKDIDPIDAREGARRQAAIEQVKALKFKDAAAAYMAAHRVAWKNDKHAAQWPATLTRYAYPIIGELPLHLTEAWRAAAGLRYYINAVHAAAGDRAQSEEFQAWSRWASAEADKLDPITSGRAVACACAHELPQSAPPTTEAG